MRWAVEVVQTLPSGGFPASVPGVLAVSDAPVAGDGGHSAVPKAGKPKRPDMGEGGMEPQPQ